MKRIFLLLVLVFTLSAVNVFAASVEEGEKIFEKECAGCHGDEGEGDLAPSLNCNALINKSDMFVFDAIYNGRKDMPTFGIVKVLNKKESSTNIITNGEIKSLVMYFRSTEGDESCKNPVVPDPASVKRGEEIFNSSCVFCHAKCEKNTGKRDLEIRCLSDPIFVGSKDDEDIKDVVKNGGGNVGRSELMVSFSEFSDRDINDLISYIRHISSH